MGLIIYRDRFIAINGFLKVVTTIR